MVTVWRPKRLTPAQLEERRMAAARLLRAGRLSQAEIARRMGVSRATVTRWKKLLEQEGIRGLRARPHPGRPSKLSEEQWQHLLQILQRGAIAAGFPTERWTLQQIAEVIRREFGVRSHPRSLGRCLRARGGAHSSRSPGHGSGTRP